MQPDPGRVDCDRTTVDLGGIIKLLRSRKNNLLGAQLHAWPVVKNPIDCRRGNAGFARNV